MSPSSDLLDLAARAAVRAARFLEREAVPADPSHWTRKGPNDFVTACDRRAEELIADVLLREEPGSSMMGEELTPTGAATPTGLVWVVDPIDGTTNFVHRFPFYSVSVAAAVDGELVAGTVVHVDAQLVYGASRGGGAWVHRGLGQDSIRFADGARLNVSSIRDPAHALIGTGFPFRHLERLEEYQRQFVEVTRSTSGVRRAGSAALDLVWVASGRFDGFWELELAPWDIAAGLVLIREAGGVVTNQAGRTIGAEHTSVVAGSPPMHEWLMTVVGRTDG